MIDKEKQARIAFYDNGGMLLIKELLVYFDIKNRKKPIKLADLRRRAFEVAWRHRMPIKIKRLFVIMLIKQAIGKGFLKTSFLLMPLEKLLFAETKEQMSVSQKTVFYIADKARNLDNFTWQKKQQKNNNTNKTDKNSFTEANKPVT